MDTLATLAGAAAAAAAASSASAAAPAAAHQSAADATVTVPDVVSFDIGSCSISVAYAQGRTMKRSVLTTSACDARVWARAPEISGPRVAAYNKRRGPQRHLSSSARDINSHC